MKLKYFALYVIVLGILVVIAQVFFREQFPWLS